MKIKNIVVICSGLLLLSLMSQVGAQSGPAKPNYEITGGEAPKDGPRGIQLQDGVIFYPSAILSVGQDDNLFYSNTDKKSSAFYLFNPNLRLVANNADVKLGVEYDAKIGRYTSSSADNYQDQRINGSAEMVFSSRVGLRLGALYAQGHDPRGTTDRGTSNLADEFYNTGPSVLFAYGAKSAAGRIEIEASSYKKRYTNNRGITFLGDRDTDSYAGRFYVRVAPKTSLLLEVREDKLDYSSPFSFQDSKERRYLVGATWDATAATSGTVKFGQIRKDFSASNIKDSSGTGWEAAIQWAPLTYSKFDFFTSKSFGESTGLGDFILSKRYGAAWNHTWDSRLSTGISYLRADDGFSGNPRNDTTDSISFKVNFKPMRWLTLGGEYIYTNRDSTVPGFNYKKNIYLLSLGATL